MNSIRQSGNKALCHVLFCISFAMATGGVAADSGDPLDLDSPAHRYWNRPLKDPFSVFKARYAEGEVKLDRTSEKAFVSSLLAALGISESSQLLVFSTTSLQLSRISPRNPRAIYFSDDIYLGWVPGGKIEIASIDPELGCIFYIFDIPDSESTRPLQIERATRCMNCHAGEETGNVPGLSVKSVVPGPRGGSIDSFRINQSGHGIPLSERFGGWHLTGGHELKKHWGNVIGKLWKGELSTKPNPPGENFDWSRYPVATSDILAHLLLEHQAGFVNRVVEATYLARAFTHQSAEADLEELTAEQIKLLEVHATRIIRYSLFADEATLPPGGIEPDESFASAFLQKRRPSSDGDALRDLDLSTRLFKFRCSYLVFSPLFQNMPAVLRERVFEKLAAALRPESPGDYAYLPDEEKAAIRKILKETLPELPVGW
jgi:hypothetical protein